MIPFYIPTVDAAMIGYVTECLQSGWLNTGPWVQRWEQALQAYCGADEVIAVSSNTAGMEIALRWLGIGPGDEVIVPAYSYCASAHVVWNLGAKPIFWDCGANFLPDPQLLPSLISAHTKAIIAVDFGGIPAEYAEIKTIVHQLVQNGIFSPKNEIQEKLGRPLIMADAAHSIGASRDGILSGQLADISVFSFHSAKNITTGDGGAICLKLPEIFDSENIKQWMCSTSLHGKSQMAEAGKAAGNYGYDISYPGIKGNLTDFQAAMGLAQLERYESEILPARKSIAERYSQALSDFEWAGLPQPGNSSLCNAWHLYPLLIRWISAEKRNLLIQKATENGIGFSVHYTPVPALQFYREQGYDSFHYPNSERISASEISLPLYEKLSVENQNRVLDFLIREIKNIL